MKKTLFLIPIIFLLLPFINIYFALLAFGCLFAPILFLALTKSRLFCQNYCPRSKLLIKTKHFSLHKHPPKIFSNGFLRNFFLIYFMINLVIIIGTTISVAFGNIEPMPYVRLLLIIPVAPIPQLFPLETIDWLVHLSYRMYSMILTTLVIGLLFAVLFRPRTWCQVCPITSVNNMFLKKQT